MTNITSIHGIIYHINCHRGSKLKTRLTIDRVDKQHILHHCHRTSKLKTRLIINCIGDGTSINGIIYYLNYHCASNLFLALHTPSEKSASSIVTPPHTTTVLPSLSPETVSQIERPQVNSRKEKKSSGPGRKLPPFFRLKNKAELMNALIIIEQYLRTVERPGDLTNVATLRPPTPPPQNRTLTSADDKVALLSQLAGDERPRGPYSSSIYSSSSSSSSDGFKSPPTFDRRSRSAARAAVSCCSFSSA